MIRKRDLLAYCDSLAEDLSQLEETVYRLKIEISNLREKKTQSVVKPRTKTKK